MCVRTPRRSCWAGECQQKGALRDGPRITDPTRNRASYTRSKRGRWMVNRMNKVVKQEADFAVGDCGRGVGLSGCYRSGLVGAWGGFTMIEVLIAMGIFAVGFVAIAAIFPVATLLQKQTVKDVMAQQIEDSVRAVLMGRPLREADLVDPGYGLMVDLGTPAWDTDHTVNRLPAVVGSEFLLGFPAVAFTPPPARWSLNDRSYPSTVTPVDARRYFWVPLVMDADQSNASRAWRVYVFVLRREDVQTDKSTGVWANPNDPAAVPGVAQIGVADSGTNRFDFDNSQDEIRKGDQVLGEFGTVYEVDKADAGGINIKGVFNQVPVGPASKLWYGRAGAGGSKSPTMKIMEIVDSDLTDVVR